MKAITTRILPHTERGPARVTASAEAGASRVNSVSLSLEEAGEEPHCAAALALCKKMGWGGSLVSGTLNHKGDGVFVFVTVKTDQKIYPTAVTVIP